MGHRTFLRERWLGKRSGDEEPEKEPIISKRWDWGPEEGRGNGHKLLRKNQTSKDDATGVVR